MVSPMVASYSGMITQDCRFCELIERIPGDALVVVLDDAYPVTNGHRLIVPRRHIADAFDLDDVESLQIGRLLRQVRGELLVNDPSIDGFNVGVNCGESAGQTVMHAHVHIIPRRIGDTPSPRGGIRGVIPSRMSY